MEGCLLVNRVNCRKVKKIFNSNAFVVGGVSIDVSDDKRNFRLEKSGGLVSLVTTVILFV